MTMAKAATLKRRALAVRETINRLDPADLIAIGCPADEYDPEMKGILTAIEQASDARNLADRIRRVFEQMFWSDMDFDQWQPLADELWRLSRSGQW